MDCTIEQGVTYKYSLQQYNENGIYSDRIVSNGVFADFEDAFLYDGEKQLKIRFNPKVSSFKTNVLESKVDTIGSTHPYILRNGNVSYKDFPISGLVSYQMDDTELFCSRQELGLTEITANVSSDNLVAERVFKLKVLDWLTNGKAKLFRSPAEGNYIVRLMNTSFSPTDSLGRMLHSFSSTAYEIAKFSMENLEYYGLIDARENISIQTRWATVDLLDYYNISIEGKQCLVIGRSILVGKPMAHLLLDRNGTVTVAHSKTPNLKELCQQADIIVASVGKKWLITEDMVKEGAVIIDVGINRENGKLYGDVDFDRVSQKASYITPVPGGVGQMTVYGLCENTYKAHIKRLKK